LRESERETARLEKERIDNARIEQERLKRLEELAKK
jgi:hypothetical protein